MGDENPIRTLGDYSKPSHEGYRNTIELPVGNNVVPLRSDTIRLVQKGCSFYGLRFEDPNQHLKDFLKLVDSLDLDGENKETMHLLDILMKEAISLMGRRESVLGMTSNTMYQLPSEPSRQEEFENLVMNFILNQEEKVKQLKEYMDVIGSDFMQLSLEEPPIEVEPLDETQLEDLGLNTCNHNTPFSSREVPSFDGPEPQPLLNSPSLDVSLGDVIGPEPPIKPHSSDSSRMKEMFDDDWGLESKEFSPLGEELSLFDRLNKVERGRILEAHRLEPILQQRISQRMAPSHHNGNSSSKTKISFSQNMETASQFTRDAVTTTPVTRLYLIRRSLEVLRKFHWMILRGQFN
ncbi:hypothetical protein Tco_1504897 [Tanacetum coccineum]